jgi:Tol biopolymer transport system component
MSTRLLLVAALLLATATPHAQPSGHALFEQALAKERVDGRLQEALRTYERVVTDFTSDRALAAKALVQIGLCYEKLGRDEARRAYERLVRDFADQKDAVAQARVRLAALERPGPVTAAPGAQPARRLVGDVPRIGDGPAPGAMTVAPDGQHLLFYDIQKRGFKLADIATSSVRWLTSDGPGADGVWLVRYLASRDQHHIAAVAESKSAIELRVFDVGGRGAGRTLRAWKPDASVQPFAWTPADDRIWVFVINADRTADIATVALDGTVGIVKSLPWRSSTQPPSLSPDGRFLAFDHAIDRSGRPDIFLLASDGTGEFRVEHEAIDTQPAFAPDGSGIVFGSDRRGERDLWFLPVKDGRPAGDARLVWRDIGPFGISLGFGENGSLFYYFGTNHWEVYTAPLDLPARSVGVPAVLAPIHHEMNQAPAFSPDGRYLAHLRGRGRRLVIRDMDSGGEREIPFKNEMGSGASTAWCPRGNTLLVSGIPGTVRVELGTGTVEPLQLERGWRAQCPGDGSEVVYYRFDRRPIVEGPDSIVRRSLSTGVERVLYQGLMESSTFSLSRDGSRIAFVIRDQPRARLVVMPADGGEVRELMTSGYFRSPSQSISPARIGPTVWTASGTDLIAIVRDDDPAAGFSLWTVPVDGSGGRRLGPLAAPHFEGSVFGVINATLHPNGRLFAFENHRGIVAQVWAIENLMRVIHPR